MRLIDADALKEKVALMWCDNNHITESMNEIIDNASTAIAVDFGVAGRDTTIYSRPHGEWKHNNFDEHYCNKCGNFALWSEETDDYHEVQSNFCPNCGADMRKGDAE